MVGYGMMNGFHRGTDHFITAHLRETAHAVFPIRHNSEPELEVARHVSGLQQALGPLPSVNSESAGLRDFKCGPFAS
jgi:hypothetical protein